MLRKVNLEITVLDYDRIGGSDPIGKVLLGYNRKKLEKKHWSEMVDNPRRPVIHWHVLQVSIAHLASPNGDGTVFPIYIFISDFRTLLSRIRFFPISWPD